jgi:hypothetical protein
MNVGLGLGITRLVIYAVQIVSAILLGGRPRPKSANLPEALQFSRAFCLQMEAILHSAKNLEPFLIQLVQKSHTRQYLSDYRIETW